MAGTSPAMTGTGVLAGFAPFTVIFGEKNSLFGALGPATKPLPFAVKTTAILLFLPRSRHAKGAGPFSSRALVLFAEREFPGAAGMFVMQQAVILFWSAPSRISRRVAQFVAIAATALRDVGV